MSKSLQVLGDDTLANIRVAAPCDMSWEDMRGDNKRRYCEACDLHVHNFAEMDVEEIQELITGAEGRVCGQLWRRADGTIITQDCPVGLAERAWRKARNTSLTVAAAVFTLLIFLFGAFAWLTQSRDALVDGLDQPLRGSVAVEQPLLGEIEMVVPEPVVNE